MYCAECLLDWVDEGGEAAMQALVDGRNADAAIRVRDDITRMATAALLLTGDTRHRRLLSLDRFRQSFVETGVLTSGAVPAIAWARAAFPPAGGRGRESPPATPSAVATVEFGLMGAREMEAVAVPWILESIRNRGAGR